MKLIFLYGPPSVGKLTIAKKLAKKLDWPLFHNHLTFDLAEVLYDPFTKEFFEYCEVLRTGVFEKAVEEDRDLIFTFCYVHPTDLAFVQKVADIVGEDNIQFVKIKCNEGILLQRVENEERKRFSKICDMGILDKFLDENNCTETIPFGKSLTVSTTRTSSDDIVTTIMRIL